MIISYKYKFIFIKTKKTAGTSIEIALSKYCGEKDIITPISPIDERLRKKLLYKEPQNYYKPWVNYELRDFARLILKRKKAKKFYGHMPARIIKQLVSKEIWDNYFKFCFERNPWDKVVSLYFWENRNNLNFQKFSDFIQSGRAYLAGGPGGIDLYTENGEIIVDRVCLYENMAQEMKFIAEKVGLPEMPKLPFVKSNYRKNKNNYRKMYDEEDKIKIAEAFKSELSLFNYTF